MVTINGYEKSLLKRLKNSDDAAWQECFDKYAPDIYTFLSHKLPTAQDAEDVLSDTWAALIGAVWTFDEKATLRTFIFRVAYFKMVDFWRKREKYRPEIPIDKMLNSLVSSGPTSKSLEIQEAFSALPARYQDILLMSYVTGLNVKEIAAVMDCTYKAAESCLTRARKKLDENLRR